MTENKKAPESGTSGVVGHYVRALRLLDEYDHQELPQPEGSVPTWRLTYDACQAVVDEMRDTFDTGMFGREREPGRVEGIVENLYQGAFGQELYPGVQEKAANLLYLVVKDHPYTDGNKRIGAALFLEFLARNGMLFHDGESIVSQGELVALTLLIAASRPEEKDVMVALVANLLDL